MGRWTDGENVAEEVLEGGGKVFHGGTNGYDVDGCFLVFGLWCVCHVRQGKFFFGWSSLYIGKGRE